MKILITNLILILCISAGADCLANSIRSPLVIGSKKFTESVILGEIATKAIANSNVPTEHKSELGGTRILFNALVQGEIDIYPEYTGTIRQEILKNLTLDSDLAISSALVERGISMTEPLGFCTFFPKSLNNKHRTQFNR